MNQNESKRDKIVAMIMFALAILIISGVKIHNNMQKNDNEKSILIHVIKADENYSNTYKVDTKENKLGDVLNSLGVAEFEESQYGRFLVSVDGYEADDTRQEWWKVLENNQLSKVGIDELQIQNNGSYTLQFCVGY
ncbi:DUF4430 domain-containing protein [[Clostridium] polysaccharolyticum]|uniref:Transcobalamin-like C-terminal domain-containing protein n=1 Tax=[Clostridium] polysaccharolyticum TaxID=29364 RepID=A0A1I0C545_9FIRM|nr:DUF4430 domain-containing protein [[Clostridium] polysaccharolyticum]SET14584.1 protein of unknown function [[Clostridium] polysaccharolyticum]